MWGHSTSRTKYKNMNDQNLIYEQYKKVLVELNQTIAQDEPYKEGDRVEIIGGDLFEVPVGTKGVIREIKKHTLGVSYLVDLEGFESWWLNEGDFRKIAGDQFTNKL